MNIVSQVYTDNQKDPCAGMQSHPSIVCGSITYHRVSFQINSEMFSHCSQQVFCYCPECLLEVTSFHHTLVNMTPDENTCICWIGGWAGWTASLDALEKRKILYPISIWNSDMVPWPVLYLAVLFLLVQQSLNIKASAAWLLNHTA